MGIRLTAYEQEQLKQGDYLIRPVPGASGASKSIYHNPITGQEFENLPTDPRSLQLYTRVKGWRLGPAPTELKEKWVAGEAERTASFNKMVAAHKAESPLQPNEMPGFNEAVATAVAQVLKSLGINPPSEKDAPNQRVGNGASTERSPEKGLE